MPSRCTTRIPTSSLLAISIPMTPGVPRLRTVFALAGLVMLSSSMVTKLDQAIEQMHEPGGISGGMAAMTAPFASTSRIHELQESWSEWARFEDRRDRAMGEYIDRERIALRAPYTVGSWWLLITMMIRVPAMAGVLWALLRRRVHILANSDIGPRGHSLRGLTDFASRRVIPAYIAVELLRFGMGALVLHGVGPSFVASSLGVVSLVATLTLATLVLPIVTFTLVGAGTSGRARAWRSIIEVRIPLLGAGFLAFVFARLPSNVRDQLDDIIRDWAIVDVAMNTAAMIALGLLLSWVCAAIRWTPRRIGSEPVARGPLSLTTVLVVAGVAVGLIVGGLVVPAWRPALFPSGLIVGLWAALSFPRQIRDLSRTVEAATSDDPPPLAIRAIASLPLFGLATASLNARIGVGRWDATRIASMALPVLALVAFWLFVPDVRSSPLRPRTRAALTGVLAVFPLAWALGSRLDGLFRATGVIGLFTAFCATAVVGFAAVDSVLPRAAGSLLMIHIRRIPLVTSAIIVLLLSNMLATTPGFHRVHTINDRAAGSTGNSIAVITLTEHLDAWIDAQPTARRDAVQPMFLVATSGGGIRAAYWQVLVNNCLFRSTKPPDVVVRTDICAPGGGSSVPVAIASGISGGSVGLALSLAHSPAPVDVVAMFNDGWIDPVSGNLLFVDIPNALLNLPFGRDRARALEEEWIRRAPSMAQGLFAVQLNDDPDKRFPLVLLSSSTVSEGCRLNVSVLDSTHTKPGNSCRAVPDTLESARSTTRNRLLGATRDVSDYLEPRCGRPDLQLATAALLSARFPIVSPPGGIDRPKIVNGGSCVPPDDPDAIYLIDGGFVDGTGARPMASLIPEIRDHLRERNATRGDAACIQPVVLQVDNGYTDLTRRSSATRPGGVRSALLGFLSAAGGAADSARQDLALAARDGLDVGCDAPERASRYVHIHPEAHPGIEAPLGWTLSRASRIDLESQLFSPDNVAAVHCVKAWLSSDDVAAACSSAMLKAERALSE